MSAGLILTMGSGGVPAGAYTGKFAGVEPTPANQEKGYGPGLKWSWEVVGGTHNGALASRITTDKPSPQNACGKIIAGLLGRTPAFGEQLPVASLVGKTFLVVVAETKTGGTRVETVTALPASS